MRTSPPGQRAEAAFTLVELAAVLFVLGLVLALAAPRLSGFGAPSPDRVMRSFAMASETAFDTALMTRREQILVVDPVAGAWALRDAASPSEPATEAFHPLAVDAVFVDGEERPHDVATEVRFLPGGRVAPLRVRLRGQDGTSAAGETWTLLLDPWSGTVDVLEGDVVHAA